MPYLDLPFRREASAPRFDPADPSSIRQYFADLDLLFDKHQVSDISDRKKAAVNYTDITTERLWKSGVSYSDQAHSYEDFKAEVIQLYPEALEDHQYTIFSLKRLISDRAQTEIRSERELGEYYRGFRLISHHLITKRRLGVPEQGHHFLAGFKPGLASAVHSRLERKLLDHRPLDPYSLEEIYEAALFTLRSQACAPSVPSPRDMLSLPSQPPNSVPPTQAPPQAVPTFLRPPEHLSLGTPTPVPSAQAPADKQHAPPSLTPRDGFSPSVQPVASPRSEKQTPSTVEAFPEAQTLIQVKPASEVPKSSCLAVSQLAPPPRRNPPPPIPARTSIPPVPAVPSPSLRFLPIPQPSPVTQQSTAVLTSTSQSQPSAPAVSPPRDVLSPCVLSFGQSPPFRTPPSAAPTFPPAQKPSLSVEVTPVSSAQGHQDKQPAPIKLSPRRVFSPQVQALGLYLPRRHMPQVVEAFPLAQATIQVEPPKTAKSSYSTVSPPVQPPRHVPPPPIPTPTSALPAPTIPVPFQQLLQARHPLQVAGQSTALSTSPVSSHHYAPSVSSPRRNLLRVPSASAFPSTIRTPPLCPSRHFHRLGSHSKWQGKVRPCQPVHPLLNAPRAPFQLRAIICYVLQQHQHPLRLSEHRRSQPGHFYMRRQLLCGRHRQALPPKGARRSYKRLRHSRQVCKR